MHCAIYFAPRGETRILNLGSQVAQRYLSPMDRLIALVGGPGAGKSALIKGMFPGLELTNDDQGVNVRPLPLLRLMEDSFYTAHTYHIDVRFEQAFTQMHILVDAVKKALSMGKRVIVEHFELIAPMIEQDADILIGVGEEVIVTRPNFYGPTARNVFSIVEKSLRYRKMAHTAEDLTLYSMEQLYGLPHGFVGQHGDVRHGFLLELENASDYDIDAIERHVHAMIDDQLDVALCDEVHITIGEDITFHCSGPRIHVKNTREIENFRLLRELHYDPKTNLYIMTGFVGEELSNYPNNLNLNLFAQ